MNRFNVIIALQVAASFDFKWDSQHLGLLQVSSLVSQKGHAKRAAFKTWEWVCGLVNKY